MAFFTAIVANFVAAVVYTLFAGITTLMVRDAARTGSHAVAAGAMYLVTLAARFGLIALNAMVAFAFFSDGRPVIGLLYAAAALIWFKYRVSTTADGQKTTI